MTDATAGRQRAAVIYNPTKSGLRELRDAVGRAERLQEFAPSLWLETAVEDPGKGMALEALAAGVDLVIAVGGDGTVRAVAAALRDSGMPLGLVPLGTGNLFARNLGIPVNDPFDAVVLAFSGLDRAVDVLVADLTRPDGSVESHVSLVMSGIGIDATMIATTNPELKRRVGWLAYVDAGLRAIPASKPFRAVHRMDGGRPHRSRLSSMLIANLGYLPGNLELIPDARTRRRAPRRRAAAAAQCLGVAAHLAQGRVGEPGTGEVGPRPSTHRPHRRQSSTGNRLRARPVGGHLDRGRAPGGRDRR
ncbi:MAG: hypothetical protein K0S05_1486 [Agromyces sp.]|nr:hypothetical protein [Agromyces sp.]